jgi:hypothetical protein
MDLRGGLLDQSLVEIVANFLAFPADIINSVDALVDFFAVEDASLKFFDTDAEKVLVVLFDLVSSGLVAGKVLLVGLIVVGVVEKVLRSSFRGPTRLLLLLLSPGHLVLSAPPEVFGCRCNSFLE